MLLKASGITKSFGAQTALHGVDFDVLPGEIAEVAAQKLHDPEWRGRPVRGQAVHPSPDVNWVHAIHIFIRRQVFKMQLFIQVGWQWQL